MSLEKKLLPINELKVGMITTSDIKFQGRLLLAKDAPITETTIKTLIHNYIVDKVEVYFENNSTDVIFFEMSTVENLENSFNEFSLNLEHIFDTINNIKVSGIDELRSFTKKIQSDFIATKTVVRSMLFYNCDNHDIYRHSINVSAISFILGKWLGFNESEINLLTYSAMLHDFGKMKIDSKILNKKGKLSYSENEILKSHTIYGYDFVKAIPYLDPSVSFGVLMHHERMDGSGYPLGITGDKIHKFAKVIAIADLFDSIISNNYSSKVYSTFDALKIIHEESLKGLDTNYCNMFLNHVINYCMGENVILNDNRTCKIIQVRINDWENPILLYNGKILDLRNEKDLYVKNFVLGIN
jgi:HD-GYP domain-containing protein (c-di-GMP phosphodiesterase class II)